MRVSLPQIVATAATIPTALVLLTRKTAPWPLTFVLSHIAFTGYCVALACAPPLASHTTWLLGKVGAVGRRLLKLCTTSCMTVILTSAC